MTNPLADAYGRRAKKADKVQNVAALGAGAVGAGLGAAKLRDEHRKQYPGRFDAAVRRAGQRATRLGAKPSTVEHATEKLISSHPGFKTLAAATGAGIVATTSDKIGDHFHAARKKVEHSTLAKAFGISKALACGPNCGHLAMVAEGERRVVSAVGHSELQKAVTFRQHHIGRARAYHSEAQVKQAQRTARENTPQPSIIRKRNAFGVVHGE